MAGVVERGPTHYLRYPIGMRLVKCECLSATYNPIKPNSADHSFDFYGPLIVTGSEPTGLWQRCYGRDKDTDRVDGEIEAGFRRASPYRITVDI